MFCICSAQNGLYNTGSQQKLQMSEMSRVMLTFMWLYTYNFVFVYTVLKLCVYTITASNVDSPMLSFCWSYFIIPFRTNLQFIYSYTATIASRYNKLHVSCNCNLRSSCQMPIKIHHVIQAYL